MKIVINALSARIGGGLTYIANILPELGRAGDEYVVLIDRDMDVSLIPEHCGESIRMLPVSVRRFKVGRSLYEQVFLCLYLRRNKPDIVLCPAGIAPAAAACKVVLLLRNMNHLNTGIRWNLTQRVRMSLLKTVVRLSARRADRVIYVSKTSGMSFCHEMRIPKEKTRVIYHGVSDRFEAGGALERRLAELILKPFILSVSSIYRYKNFIALIEAYGALLESREIPHDLIIAGKNLDSPYYESMERTVLRLGLADRVHLVGEVEYAQIPSLYRRCSLFVFPSYLETFGHPLLEAMKAGVPMAVADTAVSREIVGDAAVFFEASNVCELAEVMAEILSNRCEQRRLVATGRERVQQFSWRRTARELTEVFEELGVDG